MVFNKMYSREVLILSTLLSLNIHAEILVGKIVKVHDGDGTIRLLDATNMQHKIRLSGIDAPELKQPFGHKSKQYLISLIAGRKVKADCHKQDKYGRNVCKIVYQNKDINLEMVKAGFAWWYHKYKNEQTLDDRLRYLHAQEKAQKSEIGLWSGKGSIPPWEWRKNKSP